MKVLLLGAGASRGTFRFDQTPIPVSAEFGQVLNQVRPDWFERYPALPKVVAHLGLDPINWSLEDVWACVDYYSKFSSHESAFRILPNQTPWDHPEDVKRALLDVYGIRCDRAAEQLPIDGSYTLGRLLSELAPDDVLVSFNYDTIAERLAGGFGHRLRAPRAQPSSASPGPIFAKPHGSVSWRMRDGDRSVCWEDGGQPILDSLSSDLIPGENPVLLGAVPMKSELIREIHTAKDANGLSWPNLFATIACQWRTVVESIRTAQRVIAVGYSFPADDRYGRFLFQEALRRRRDKPVVEFYERRDCAAERAAEIMRVFSCHAEHLHYRGPVEHTL
jgi:hypothetical protein